VTDRRSQNAGAAGPFTVDESDETNNTRSYSDSACLTVLAIVTSIAAGREVRWRHGMFYAGT